MAGRLSRSACAHSSTSSSISKLSAERHAAAAQTLGLSASLSRISTINVNSHEVFSPASAESSYVPSLQSETYQPQDSNASITSGRIFGSVYPPSACSCSIMNLLARDCEVQSFL